MMLMREVIMIFAFAVSQGFEPIAPISLTWRFNHDDIEIGHQRPSRSSPIKSETVAN